MNFNAKSRQQHTKQEATAEHLVSAAQFRRSEIEELLALADEFEHGFSPQNRSQTLVPLFLEPSTRTRLSFESAMYRLGGHVLTVPPQEQLSMMKGETFADTIRVLSGYADIVVARTPSCATFQTILDYSVAPVINAGNGSTEHPTQALVDLYAIWRCKGRLDDLRIGVVGDIKHSRVAHSLLHVLCEFDSPLELIAPPGLECPETIRNFLISKRATFREHQELSACLPQIDVLYVLMLEEGRMCQSESDACRNNYFSITAQTLTRAKTDLIILHALPRIHELAQEIDRTRHAVYFQQAQWGVSVRAALLSSMLPNSSPNVFAARGEFQSLWERL